MSSGQGWESDEEIALVEALKKKQIEEAQNDTKYYRWRELREKYKEIDEYFILNTIWTDWRKTLPKEIEITQQMVDDFKKEKGYYSCSGQPFSDERCKKALIIANGDFDKATKWL